MITGIKNRFIKVLERLLFSLTNSEETVNQYSSLSPSVHKSADTPYYKSLKWAFENRRKEDIKNLAITGPYGSGKSTVIQSFNATYTSPEYKPLQISLASFGNEMLGSDKKEDTDAESKDESKSGSKRESNGESISDQKSKEITLRNIETSILQQIFFYEKDDKIPDSRFKKIRHRTRAWQGRMALFTLFMIVSIALLIDQAWVASIFKAEQSFETYTDSIHYFSLTVTLIGSLWLLYKMSRILWSISIEKFKIKNVKFTVGDKENKSILNHHLDEIIYFFSVRPYNVIIIEDLDRFQQTEIFIKLREINLLLNKSKVLNGKHILFIYAVRDDMFKDVERTKFFDFVIPIIPIINSSNSGEKLRTWLSENKIEDFSEEFIDGISFYIDDMRLLKNICNEYMIYSEIQDDYLQHDKLFALLTYKNKYPKDYVDLDRQCGELYDTLSSKSDLVKEKTIDLNAKISEAQERIDYLKSQDDMSITNLRKLYIGHSYEKLPGFNGFTFEGKLIAIDTLASDEHWDLFKRGKLQYNEIRLRQSRHISQNARIDFGQIEIVVDPNLSYNEKVKVIEARNSGEIDHLIEEINNMKREKDSLKRLPFHSLLSIHRDINVPKPKSLDHSFLEYVLTSNLIGEDYSNYTSLFHGESLTRVDHQFILNVRQGRPANCYIALNKVDNVIKKLSEFYFESDSILNISLLDVLLSDAAVHSKKIDRLYQQLVKSSSLEFIRKYREVGRHKHDFIKVLSKRHHDLLNQLTTLQSLPESEFELFIKDLLSYADSDDFDSGSNKRNLKGYIEENPSVLAATENQQNTYHVIKKININIKSLNFEGYNEDLKRYIYENNLYVINAHNIDQIIKQFGKNDRSEFQNGTLSAIKSSNVESLEGYIDANLVDYISTVYTKIKRPTDDKEEDIIAMLSHRAVRDSLEHEILNKWEGKLTKIRANDITTTPTFLLSNNKVKASWSNVFRSVDEQLDPKALVHFLNLEENNSQLAQLKAPTEMLEKHKKSVDTILDLNDLTEDSLANLVKGLDNYDFLSRLEELSESWITALITKKVIPPKIEHFEQLAERGDHTHVQQFLVNSSLMSGMDVDPFFDKSDIVQIMKSDSLNIQMKAKRIKNLADIESIIDYLPAAKAVADVMLQVHPVYTNQVLSHQLVLLSEIANSTKIRLFNHFIKSSQEINMSDFLTNLGEPYASIANKGRRTKLPISDINLILLRKLESIGYISSFSEQSGGILGSPYLRVNLKFKK